MKSLLLLFSLLFLSACSPKYKIVKEYHPPVAAQSSDAQVCLGLCDSKRTACKSDCEAVFSSCQVKAHRIANQRYAKKMQQYTGQLENYVDAVQRDRFEMQFYSMGYYGYPFYRPGFAYGPYGGYANRLFWYDPIPVYNYTRQPRKPSLAQEKLKAEAEFCNLDCGCTQKFDDCYIGCGGKVLSKKLCIENCP